MNFPADLKYSKEHEWARLSEDGKSVTVGITDHAQKELGDIVFLEITRKAGSTVKKGETFGTVESVKTLSDVYAPVSGTITAVNEPLSNSPETINDDPYGEGWMIQIELSDPGELSTLMSAGEYQTFLESEAEGH